MSNRHYKKNNLNNKLALFGITLVVILLAFTIGIRSKSLKEQEQMYQMKEDTLSKEIKKEEERTELLNEKKKTSNSLNSIEEIAREHGFIYKDEIVFKSDEE